MGTRPRPGRSPPIRSTTGRGSPEHRRQQLAEHELPRPGAASRARPRRSQPDHEHHDRGRSQPEHEHHGQAQLADRAAAGRQHGSTVTPGAQLADRQPEHGQAQLAEHEHQHHDRAQLADHGHTGATLGEDDRAGRSQPATSTARCQFADLDGQAQLADLDGQAQLAEHEHGQAQLADLDGQAQLAEHEHGQAQLAEHEHTGATLGEDDRTGRCQPSTSTPERRWARTTAPGAASRP